MTKIILITVTLLAFCSLVSASPIFIKSSSKLTAFKENMFMDGLELINLIDENLLSSAEKPNNIVLIDVKVSDVDLFSNVKSISEALKPLQNVKKYFADSEHNFFSPYITNIGSSEFMRKLIHTTENHGYKSQSSNLESLQTPGANTTDVIVVNWAQMPQLDQSIKTPMNKLNPSRVHKENTLVIMRLSDLKSDFESDINIGNAFIQLGERNLQTEVETEEEEQTNNEENSEFLIPISAPNFAAYVISIGLVLAVYYVYEMLASIKVPTRNYDKQFVLGKEY